MLEITPVLEYKSNKPLYLQLADYIKQEIAAGKIKSQEKLPSKRKLSDHLGLSLNTIQSAYDQLNAEGFIESRPRKGFYAIKLEDDIMANQEYSRNCEKKNESIQANNKIDFNSGKIDVSHFPYSTWRKLTVCSLYEDQGDLFYTGDPQGELELRKQIAAYLFASRGVRCSSDQIIIGAGTQVLMGILGLVIGKENIFAMEDPGFNRIRAVLEDLGASVNSIPLDNNGIDINQLANTHADAVYVTPPHQFPYGMIMPISRRLELLKWAEERTGYIIEDDYDGEYRYKGKPIPSLQGLDTKGRVVYFGTFSKSLIPSIRISYMVLPEELLKIYKKSFTIYKQTASRLHQDTLARFMKNGHWQTHLNKMRALYRKKHQVLITSVKRYLRDNVKIIGEHSGLHIVLEVNNRMEEEVLIRRAFDAGVKVYPLSVYHDTDIKKDHAHILIGFGGLSESEIDKGIQRLKKAWNC
ncbi:PLP-dependent aminotransferase family protein [Niallia sp. NCCP-28]|uniref:MocR-like pyridoxine biosynthesis transcription factor PdxR n=1 Tax=Niallia sp. NCCP-28 TaxID=2934712 RepID=UPI00208B7F37|nr:PLP-dependent aminotransferase family protein [Niallia sp. NCCP-28]GKU84725.1 GntR family transcriptional regulator [Niallia sp. NCCP-28]